MTKINNLAIPGGVVVRTPCPPPSGSAHDSRWLHRKIPDLSWVRSELLINNVYAILFSKTLVHNTMVSFRPRQYDDLSFDPFKGFYILRLERNAPGFLKL